MKKLGLLALLFAALLIILFVGRTDSQTPLTANDLGQIQMPPQTVLGNTLSVTGPLNAVPFSQFTSAINSSIPSILPPIINGDCVRFIAPNSFADAGAPCFTGGAGGGGGGGTGSPPGGTNGQVQYNNAGAFGGLTNAQLTTNINTFTSALSGAVPGSGGGTANFLRSDGTWTQPPVIVGGTNTQVQFNNGGILGGLTSAQLTAQINVFSGGVSGLAPASGGGTTNFLRADGTWQAPPSSGGGTPGGTNTQVQYNNAGVFGGLTNTQLTADINPFTSALSGATPASGGGLLNFLRADGTWATIVGVSPGGISLAKNTAGQNFTFELINVSNNLPLTGATVAGFTSRDGGAQAATAGTFTGLGNGVYNYAPTQAETNGNTVSFLATATNAVPENIMFFTAGFQKNTAGQHVTFAMFSTAGIADASASVSVFVTKDGGSQAGGAGTVTNLGRGQYDYAPTQAETNCSNCSYLFTATGDVPQNISAFTTTANVVTSVGLSAPTGLAVSGSPVTSTGTLGLSWSGTIPNAQIPNFSSSVNGGVPSSGGGTTNFLRADGNWAAPAGGGGNSLQLGGTNTFQVVSVATGTTIASSFVTITAGSGANVTVMVTLPAATTVGQSIFFAMGVALGSNSIVQSTSSNVIALNNTTAGTNFMASGGIQKFCILVANGTNWQQMAGS